MVDSTQSITRVYSTTNRQTVLGVDNRRTTVINKVTFIKNPKNGIIFKINFKIKKLLMFWPLKSKKKSKHFFLYF